MDEPPQNWKYSKGFINEDMIKEHMPQYSKKAMVMMCGPPPMIKYACVPNLEKNGFQEGSYLSF